MEDMIHQICTLWKLSVSSKHSIYLQMSVQHDSTYDETTQDDLKKHAYYASVPYIYLTEFHNCLKQLHNSTSVDNFMSCSYILNSGTIEKYLPNQNEKRCFTETVLGRWCVDTPIRNMFKVYIDLIQKCTIIKPPKINTSEYRTYTQLVEEWSYVYKNDFQYRLLKRAGGKTKEDACSNEVTFHVMLTILHHDHLSKALYKIVDFFQGYDCSLSVDRRHDIYTSFKHCKIKML